MNFRYYFMPDTLPIIKKMALYACHFKTKSYLCINFCCTRQFESKLSLLLLAKVLQKERKIMAIEIKAIPTLEGKDAERFIERADEAERKFKGFDGIENTPAFKAMKRKAVSLSTGPSPTCLVA